MKKEVGGGVGRERVEGRDRGRKWDHEIEE